MTDSIMSDRNSSTMIVDKEIEPRILTIMPPSYNKSENNSEDEQQILLDGLPYIEKFSQMQLALAKKLIQDEMMNFEISGNKNISNDTYLTSNNISLMPECPIIVLFLFH